MSNNARPPEVGAQRLAVIAHSLRAGGGLSVGRNLIAAFGRVAPQHHYLLVVPSGAYDEVCAGVPNHRRIEYRRRAGLWARWRFDVFRLPGIIRDFRPGVILCLGNRGLDIPSCPQAILCHDAHLFYPARHFSGELLRKKLVKRYHKRRLRCDLRRVSLLLCQTEVAEKRMRETFAYEGPTAIVPNAVSRWAMVDEGVVRVPEPLAPFADRWRLLCLTRYCAHKNLEAIVRVFERFREALRDTIVFLTIGEEDHPHARRLLRSIRQKGLEDCIRNVGPLRQAELAGYYRHCDGLLLPTLLESFSATYVEAMNFGCPILTSDLDFARAVCADAAMYFDPWNPESIKDAILRLKGDVALAEELARRGRRLVATTHRSWDDVATDVVNHLLRLARRGEPIRVDEPAAARAA